MADDAQVVERKARGTSLGPVEFFLLDQWGRQLDEAFHCTPYLVGSVMRAERGYRDVDVRMLLPRGADWLNRGKTRLRAVNVALSLWGQHVTGLPIDCQFQTADDFHAEGGQRRGALGIRTNVEAREDWEAVG